MTDANYADDHALLTDTLTQTKSQLHSLKQMKDYTSFKQKETVYTQSSKPLRLEDRFT